MSILRSKNARYKYVPIIHHMDGFVLWLFFCLFLAIWPLPVDWGDKIWSLQIIHFYFK